MAGRFVRLWKEVNELQLPKRIMEMIAGETYESDSIGLSDSSVLIFEDKVLKIQEYNKEAENEYRMLRWLVGKLSVPEVYAYETCDGKAYLLMGKCPGQMACDEEYMRNPAQQVRLLAEGLKSLWEVPVADCPTDRSLRHKLAEAQFNIRNGLVDLDLVESGTFGEGGFENPEALLKWLYDNQPEEESALSHGDYCLPNVFFKDGRVSGFIDLGRAGVADKWCDIALCYRSLRHNHSGRYNGRVYPDFDELSLFRELGIEPDWEKIKYYILLDELF